MRSTTMTLCPLVSGAIPAHKPLPLSDLAALPPKNTFPPQKGLHLSQLITIILIPPPPVRLTSSTLATLKLKPSPPADTSSREDSALNPPEFNSSQITVIPSPGGPIQPVVRPWLSAGISVAPTCRGQTLRRALRRNIFCLIGSWVTLQPSWTPAISLSAINGYLAAAIECYGSREEV